MKKSVDLEKQKTLRLSVREGSANSVMVGAGHSFIIPYALALGASNITIGFLNSFVGLIGPLAQLKSSSLMEKHSRKKIIVYSVLFQSLMWIPIMLLGLLFFYDSFILYLPYLLIIFYSIHIILGSIAGPVWFSLMGDLVPPESRGKYFSFRERFILFFTVTSMLVAGFLLDYFKTKGFFLLGFSIIFSAAMISRLYSGYLFTKHYEPKFSLNKGYYFSFFDFIRHARENNFGRFVLFVGAVFFAISISSPFFAVYMLNELHFSYAWFTLITLAPVVIAFLVLPFWGRVMDKYGSRLVIFISVLSVPFYPLLWIVSTNKFYLLIFPSLTAGIFWSIFTVASTNFVYESVKPEHRSLCSAYLNILMGVGIFAGSIFGGLIAKFGSVEFFNNLFNLGFSNIFLYIFLISAFFRFLVVLIFLPRIKEMRRTKMPPILIKELKSLESFGHGANHFNSAMFGYLDIEKTGKRDVDIIGKVFK